MGIAAARNAIDAIVDARKTVTEGLSAFLAGFMKAQALGAELLPSRTDIQSRLIRTVSGLYQAQIDADEAMHGFTKTQVEQQTQIDIDNHRAAVELMKVRIAAAIEAAKALAAQVSAVYAPLSVSTGISSSTDDTV